MIACRTASVAATAALLAVSAIAACQDMKHAEVPPLTTARPDGAPVLGAATVSLSTDAKVEGGVSSALTAPLESPVKAKFVDTPAKLEAGLCERVLVAIVKGKVTTLGETLAAGDVLVLTNGEPFEVKGAGTLVWAEDDLSDCVALSRPPTVKTVIRGTAAPELKWAGGTMSAHLDVASPPPSANAAPLGAARVNASPELYLGRLEGTAAVPEHVHSGSWEILAAVEANGTFVLDGTEGRLAARQIVIVPPGAKHAWKPEPGSKLVAIQMYSPPGPEQRFLGLAAAEKDAGGRDAR